MSLTSAVQIGRSALAASQLGIQVAGNNLANAATPGYSRQIGDLSSIRGATNSIENGAGRGVRVSAIRRQVDVALQARLVSSTSETAAANVRQQITSQVESTLGELGSNDLSSELTGFFKVWSERANQTKSSASVVQQGDKLAQFVKGLRGHLTDQRKQVDGQLAASVGKANELIQTIARLNSAISSTEGAGTPANTLRDQRDTAVTSLSEMMDVATVDRGLGGVDVLVGSAPIVLGSRANTLGLRTRVEEGVSRVSVEIAGDRAQELAVTSGQIGALLATRGGAIDDTIKKIDRLTSQVIFEVNKLHSTGTNLAGLTTATGSLGISAADRSLAMNDPANESFTNLPFAAQNGGFLVHVKQKGTGAEQTVRINVDLDGTTNAGLAGTTDDTTAEGIRSSLNAIGGINATFTTDGKIKITADEGFEFSFSDDSSGSLAVLGVNSYFTGKDASDIAVRADLLTDSSKLAAGRIVNGQFTENGTTLALAKIQDQHLAGLGGQTITSTWQDTVQSVGGAAATAMSNADSTSIVHEALQNQRDSLSGVNTDEESISLMDYQRQYQAAARVISTVDQMTQVLLAML